MGGHRILEAAQAFARIEIQFRAGDEDDPAMSAAEQVLGHGDGTGVVVDAQHRVLVLVWQMRVDEHGRQRLRQVLGQEAGVLGIGRKHQQAVDAAAHGAQCATLLFLVAVVAGYQQVLAARARHSVDAADQLGKEFAVQVRQDHANSLSVAAAQAARGRVRAVAQAVGHFQHDLAYRFGDVVVSVERP